MLSRRLLLLAPAVVGAASLMPVKSILRIDPLVYGIAWQSWPFNTPRPYHHAFGATTSFNGREMPLSHFLRERKFFQFEYWKPI